MEGFVRKELPEKFWVHGFHPFIFYKSIDRGESQSITFFFLNVGRESKSSPNTIFDDFLLRFFEFFELRQKKWKYVIEKWGTAEDFFYPVPQLDLWKSVEVDKHHNGFPKIKRERTWLLFDHWKIEDESALVILGVQLPFANSS